MGRYLFVLLLLTGGLGCSSAQLYVVRRNVWGALPYLPDRARNGVPASRVEDVLEGREDQAQPVPSSHLRQERALRVDQQWLVPGVSGDGHERSFLITTSQDLRDISAENMTHAVQLKNLSLKPDVVPRSDLKVWPALLYDDDHVILLSTRRRVSQDKQSGMTTGGVMLMALGATAIIGGSYLLSVPNQSRPCLNEDSESLSCGLDQFFYAVDTAIVRGLEAALLAAGISSLGGGVALTVLGGKSRPRPLPAVPADPVLLQLDRQPVAPAVSIGF